MLFLFKRFDGLNWVVIGEENIPDTPFIIASKHQSIWDTIFFTAYFSDEAKGKALRQLLKMAKECSSNNRPIVIFPEGTRVNIGEKGDYKSGCFALYKYLDIPCIPVALNSGLYWQTKGYGREEGTIKVKFLKGIEPGLPKKKFQSLLEDKIETASEELLINKNNEKK